ncbi:MAG: hypothetical protein QFB87_04685 [Patescibacteria group bacterium]|nr:hypothetical protein [Patescibacteria group bacterium]
MFLRESMEADNREQIAYLVTLAHDEYLELLMADRLEPRNEEFDDWLSFIGWAAVKMSVPNQRQEV